jgi:hypothetical protein
LPIAFLFLNVLRQSHSLWSPHFHVLPLSAIPLSNVFAAVSFTVIATFPRLHCQLLSSSWTCLRQSHSLWSPHSHVLPLSAIPLSNVFAAIVQLQLSIDTNAISQRNFIQYDNVEKR